MEYKQIILADNQDITRLGLKAIVSTISAKWGEATIKEVAIRSELVSALGECPSAIVVMDFNLFGIASTDDLLHLAQRYPNAHWVLFSAKITEQLLQRISAEPNISVVLKHDHEHEITSALLCAADGTRFFCHHATEVLLSARSDNLTPTETEILRLIALGKSAKEIALQRNSSIHTIHTHKKNIFRKINANTTHEATRYAISTGVVEMLDYYI